MQGLARFDKGGAPCIFTDPGTGDRLVRRARPEPPPTRQGHPRMKRNRFHYRWLPLLLPLLFSCGSVKLKQMVMFDDVRSEPLTIDTLPQLRIAPLDIINIQVTSNDPSTVLAFQQQRLTMANSMNAGSGESALGVQEGYRVDEQGEIHMPFIGAVRAQGRTLNELRQEISTRLDKYILNTSVQCRFMNFRVTLLGEVNRPSTYTVPSERVTILEALGMAGDFTAYAERNNVLVIRERDGVRSTARVNVQDREIFRSPWFYLNPGDIVYVRPQKARQYATRGDLVERYGVLLVSLLSVAATVIITTR